jgi:hypothetical protein
MNRSVSINAKIVDVFVWITGVIAVVLNGYILSNISNMYANAMPISNDYKEIIKMMSVAGSYIGSVILWIVFSGMLYLAGRITESEPVFHKCLKWTSIGLFIIIVQNIFYLKVLHNIINNISSYASDYGIQNIKNCSALSRLRIVWISGSAVYSAWNYIIIRRMYKISRIKSLIISLIILLLILCYHIYNKR